MKCKGWTIFARGKKPIGVILSNPVLRELKGSLGERWG